MKKLFFLITLGILLFNFKNVYAANINFYEAEFIDNVYISKYKYANNTTYYQKARVFREIGTDKFAYCIEPFRLFEDGYNYTSTITPNNISESQRKRIEMIAYFGYGYENHSDIKWYAVAQYMIWQEVAKGIGEIYFTDTLNGNRINIYTSEINEIEELIKNYNTIPIIANQTKKLYEGQSASYYDNTSLKYYKTTDEGIRIKNNRVDVLGTLKEGEYEFTLTRTEDYHKVPIIFYQSTTSQDLMETGNIDSITIKFKLKVIKRSITINKVDKDTLQATPQGEASLDGAIYEVFTDTKRIGTIEIKNGTGTLGSIAEEKYYLKEITPGQGYTLDSNIYTVYLDDDENANPIITLTNKVIEKRIKIIKLFGEEDNFVREKGIDFEIYNKNNKLVMTVTTNDKGIVEFTLPYGEYNIYQKTTTNGYTKVEPFNIKVDNDEEEIIELKDYKIPVPDTHTNLLKIFFQFIFLLLC